jgi:signal transduction histidine kinase
MKGLKILGLALWLAVHVCTAAATEITPLQLDARMQQVSLSAQASVYVDKGGSLSFEQARQVDFLPLPAFRSAGYTADVYWYRFALSRNVEAPPSWILAMGMPYLDDVQVWLVSPEGQVRHTQFGDHFAYAQRPLHARPFALHLELPDTRPVQVYVRVQSNSAINFNAEVWQTDVFWAQETQHNFYHGIYFGILGIIVLLYLMLGGWLRDTGMLAYAGYVSSLLLLYLGMNGYVAMTFAPSLPWVSDAAVGGGVIGALIVFPLMWSALLDLKRYFPRMRWLYFGISLTGVCCLPFTVLPAYRLIAPVVMQLSMLLAVMNLVLVVALWRRQKRLELMLYFFAFIATSLGVLVQMMMTMGWLPSNFLTANAYQLTSLIHVLIMSMGLAMRIRQIQFDKSQLEQEAAIAKHRTEEQRHFVAMLSHEFRNPLTAIDRAAHIIQMKTSEADFPETGRLKKIRERTSFLSSLVDNFLVSEALDHEALVLSRSRHHLRELLETTVQNLGETLDERMMISVSPPEATFLLDESLMSMAIGNLLSNALRYSPPDSPIEIHANVNADGLVIRVVDHGSGLTQEELDMLGTPYYRATSSVGKKGSGLGYHFSSHIAEAHGGRLQARNADGGGLEVELFIPDTNLSQNNK